MKLAAAVDRSVLAGALAVEARDAMLGLPTDVRFTVTAFRSDGRVVRTATPHPSGLYGFLSLPPGDYRVRIEPPDARFLPSLRSVTIPSPLARPVVLRAMLRPGPLYKGPPQAVGLRGTVQWDRPDHPPARWALVVATITLAASGAQVSSAWTRTDGRGEFAIALAATPPDTDGNRPRFNASIAIHALPAPAVTPDDLGDLVLDDGDDAAIASAQPIQRTVVEADVEPGNHYTLNKDEYQTTPAGSTRAVSNKVILLS